MRVFEREPSPVDGKGMSSLVWGGVGWMRVQIKVDKEAEMLMEGREK